MLFALYAADPAKIDGYADALVAKSTDVNNVNVDVLKRQAKAAEQVDGELDDLIDEPFATVGKDSKRISLASAFAAGVLYTWSGAITTFNEGVNKLNKEYEDRSATSFGVPDAPAGPSGGLSPGALEEQHDKAVTTADAALKHDLRTRWHKLDATLDQAAETVNADLAEGPTEENVLALFASGALPEEAFPLLAALGIDPSKVADVLAKIRTFLSESGKLGFSMDRHDAWKGLLDLFRQLDPRAAAVILSALSDEELKALGGQVTNESGSMAGAADFYGFLLAGATPEQVTRLRHLWSLNPTGAGGWTDPESGVPLFPANPDRSAGIDGTMVGAGQGQVGDCWMLARLNAIAGADPNWPQEHVRDNGNGTISVKFYNEDGSPRWVTVTDDVPTDGASPAGTNKSLWAVYYEKAMAADNNGYDSLDGGTTETMDVYMTGKDADNLQYTHLDPRADPYDAAVQAHNQGKGVVGHNMLNSIVSGGDDDMHQKHLYYVKDILPNGDVLLGNPWGYDDITLSPDQFDDFLEDVSVVNT